jgi:hypothetical protein
LRRLPNQLGPQTIHLLIDRWFNLGQCRLRMRFSPVRHRRHGLLSLSFPVLV